MPQTPEMPGFSNVCYYQLIRFVLKEIVIELFDFRKFFVYE